MEDRLSTKEVAWVLGRSPGTVRERTKGGEIEAVRIVDGYRIPRAEVLRLARERIEAEAGRKLSDRDLEHLIDDLIATNEARLAGAQSATSAARAALSGHSPLVEARAGERG